MAAAVGLSACVFAFDSGGRVLLVRTRDRADTWEPPGGIVEPSEDPATAARRECLEETGLAVRLGGCAGVYHNVAGRLCLAFLGEAEGEPVASAETPEVGWFAAARAGAAITRPQLRLRWQDALAVRAGGAAGYATYAVQPFALLGRLPAEPRRR